MVWCDYCGHYSYKTEPDCSRCGTSFAECMDSATHIISSELLPQFILIQQNIVLDVQDSPVALNWGKTHPQADIVVAIGVVNEFRVKEIAGVCGRYTYLPLANAWAMQFDSGKPSYTRVTAAPGILLRDCLYQLKSRGLLSDPVNFATVTIKGVVGEDLCVMQPS